MLEKRLRSFALGQFTEFEDVAQSHEGLGTVNLSGRLLAPQGAAIGNRRLLWFGITAIANRRSLKLSTFESLN